LRKETIGAPEVFSIILTLILLTLRKGWFPNNARKWQMGFNSAFNGFKGTETRAATIFRKKDRYGCLY